MKQRAGRSRWAWVVVASVAALAACADDPPNPDGVTPDLGPYEEDEMEEGWSDEWSTDDPGVYKNLSTVDELIQARACSTGPTMGLNAQIAEEINCIRPGMFANISDIPNVRLGAGASPFVQGTAARGLRAAAAANPQATFQINSSWRSVVQQYILKRWEGSCGIRIAATPGRSRHESGLALDVPTSTTDRFHSTLSGNGWTWYCDRTNGGRLSGCGDPPHWDFFNGTDLRSYSVRAFQRLWNNAHPEDRIAEDGAYGPQTAARIRRAPLGGFTTGTTCAAPPAEQQPDPQPEDELHTEPQQPQPPDTRESETVAGLSNDARGRSTGTTADVWRTRITSRSCGEASVREDYSTGRYNVHRWSTQIEPTGPMRITFTRTAGSWQPALYIFDPAGELIFGGDASGAHDNAAVTVHQSGRDGAAAEVTVEVGRSTALFLYTTSWGAADSGLRERITRSARYSLNMTQDCNVADPDSSLADLHAGLTLDGMEIPRAGLDNGTLQGVHGISYEPYGVPTSHEGLTFVQGPVSWFGGPNDTGIGATETGAITGERVRLLNDPVNPGAGTLASRPEDYYYLAMRWNYAPMGKDWWRNARILLVNPDTGATVVVRPVDWGPHVRTERVVDLSPQAIRDLGLVTDQKVLVAFAPFGTPLGRR